MPRPLLIAIATLTLPTALPAVELDVLGDLRLEGYVDVLAEYTRFERNAPRHGDYDNRELWDRGGRLGSAALVTLGDEDVAGVRLALVPGAAAGPRNRYFAEGVALEPATNPELLALGAAFDGINADGALPLAGTAVPIGIGLGVPALDLVGPVPFLVAGDGGTAFSFPLLIDSAEEDSLADFSVGTAELSVTWTILDQVDVRIDAQWNGEDDVTLQQAFIDWRLDHGFDILFGKRVGWLGWEGRDAPDLYRVNHSVLGRLHDSEPTGLRLGWVGYDDERWSWTVAGHLVDRVWSDPFGLKDGDDLALGFETRVTRKGTGFIELALAYDQNATYDSGALDAALATGISLATFLDVPAATAINASLWTSGESLRTGAWAVDLQVQLDHWREDHGLLFAAEAMLVDYSVGTALGAMGMVNWRLPTETPLSATLMLSWLDPNREGSEVQTSAILRDEGGVRTTSAVEYWNREGADDEVYEVALALLANPIGSQHFSVNGEIRYRLRPDAAIVPDNSIYGGGLVQEDRSDLGFFLEFLAVLP